MFQFVPRRTIARFMILKLLIAGIAVAGGGQVQAGSVSVQASAPMQGYQLGFEHFHDFTIPQFDAALGTLQQIDILVEATAIIETTHLLVPVTLPSGETSIPAAVLTHTAEYELLSSVYQFTGFAVRPGLDMGNPIGVAIATLDMSFDLQITDPGEIASFVGTSSLNLLGLRSVQPTLDDGSPYTIDFLEVSSPNNRFLEATLTATYIFDAPATSTAVPEPSSLTLFGCAMFGLIGYEWKRKRSLVA